MSSTSYYHKFVVMDHNGSEYLGIRESGTQHQLGATGTEFRSTIHPSGLKAGEMYEAEIRPTRR